MSECLPTCDDLEASECSPEGVCQEGCQCDEGYIFSDGQCITKDQCGCIDDISGQIIPVM